MVTRALGQSTEARAMKIAAATALIAKREHVLEPVHAVDVGQAEKSENREHQDADPGAEVATVDRDQELAGERRPPGQVWSERSDRRVAEIGGSALGR